MRCSICGDGNEEDNEERAHDACEAREQQRGLHGEGVRQDPEHESRSEQVERQCISGWLPA